MSERKWAKLAVTLFLAAAPAPWLLSACSVGMAVAGKEEPNLAVCRVGATQGEIETQLGPPTSVRTLPEGDTSCSYEYELGNEPSAGRAMAHAGMDVLTLGIWELVGTPVEAVQGEKFEMTVTYGSDGKAKAIETRRIGSGF